MFKAKSPERIDLEDKTLNLPVYIDEDDYEKAHPNAHKSYQEKLRKMIGSCDIKNEVELLMQIKNINFDNFEGNDEESQVQQ